VRSGHPVSGGDDHPADGAALLAREELHPCLELRGEPLRYSTAFEDITWPTLVTPGANLEYYQIGQPEDTQQLYPGSQADNGVPWMVVVPVYQVFDGQPPMSISLPASGYFSAPGGEEGTMSEVAAAWMLRLFEYGALRSGSDYYPSIELTLMQPLLGDTCGSVGLRSLESAPP